MDIPQVLLNILAHLMFFVINLFVLPGIAEFFILKDTDANNLLKNGDEFDAEIVALKNELETLRSNPDTTPEDWAKFKKRGEKLKIPSLSSHAPYYTLIAFWESLYAIFVYNPPPVFLGK